MSTDAQIADVVTQLRISNRLLAAQLRTTMTQSELISLLASTGATNHEIAIILGTTSATVSNALVRKRKVSSRKSLSS